MFLLMLLFPLRTLASCGAVFSAHQTSRASELRLKPSLLLRWAGA